MIELIEKLKQLQGQHFTDVCEKHTFECYRMLDDGCMQSITLVIFDAGPSTKNEPRYFGHATSAEGRTIASTADSSLDVVLGSLRWSELDPEPDPAKQASLAPPEQVATPAEAAAIGSRTHDEGERMDRRDLFGMLRKRIVKK